MKLFKLAAAAGAKITVTSTATDLLALMKTAASADIAGTTDQLNAVNLYIEDGDVRVMMDGNTPTSSLGMLLKQGTRHYLRGIQVSKIKLIRAGSADVAVSVEVGISEVGETSNSTDGSLVSGDVAHDAVDSGNPVKIGARAVDPASLPSDVAVGDRVGLIASRKGELLVYSSRTQAGEDPTNDVMKTEQRYTFTRCTSDTQVKASAGFIHSITIQSTDATPTAGSIILYANTAESGTEILRFDIKATANVGIQGTQTILLDCEIPTGIYVGFTTVADVALTVAWR